MSAKEMFERLEYTYDKNDYEIFYYYEIRDWGDDNYYIGIHFNLNSQEVFSEVDIDMDLLKAINKQIEELGWLGGNE